MCTMCTIQYTPNHAIRRHLCFALWYHIERHISPSASLFVFPSLSPSFTPHICCCSLETNYGVYCAVTDCYTFSEITGDTFDSVKQVCLFCRSLDCYQALLIGSGKPSLIKSFPACPSWIVVWGGSIHNFTWMMIPFCRFQ